MSTRRILFAIRDPMAKIQPGLAKAIQAARALDASLELFHALTEPVYVEFSRIEEANVDRLRERAEEKVRIPMARLCSAGRRDGVTVTSSVTWDYPAHEAVIRRATAIGAELIIAECHKGARTRPWLIHLTDWELLRTSPLPVLLLRNGKPWRNPIVLAAVDPSHAHAKPSELDTRILKAATALGEGLHGTLHVLHAAHPPMSAFVHVAPPSSQSEAWSSLTYDAYLEQARIAFAEFFTHRKIPPSRAHLVPGDPGVVIPRFATQLHAGIVVMGAVSRSGLKRVFIGNTAERVLEALPSDVLVVKPEGLHAAIDQEVHGLRVVVPPPLALTAS
jgi:universal stress protein E